MSLNIKDPEAYRLARAISRPTGENVAQVVIRALRESLANIEDRQGKAGTSELLAIADRAAAHLKQPAIDHADLLYGEDGLPE